ncbi:hypothetical protein ACFOWM_03490 [Ferruginibacter yonginensis]|uniref:Uncharacterized protein n=1 Tax=Ferruginibacter yonginensis TaxID=1310416 RepID=A0ABV8QNS7_9BACT
MDSRQPGLPNALKQKAAKIARSVESLAERTNDWQLIQQYLCNRIADIKLTEKQQDKLQRYQFIYNQSVSGKYTESDILNSVMKLFNIELTQAYEDLKATKEIFSSVINVNKKFELNIQLQVNRNLQRKAESLGDLKASAALEKNRIALLAMIEEEEENNAESFEGHTIEATFNPSLIGADKVDLKELMDVINNKRKAKLNPKLFEHLEFVDIPHE